MDARDSPRMASSDPPGMMMGPNSYGGGVTNSSMPMVMPSSTGMMPGMRFSYPMISSGSKTMDTPGSFYHGDGTQVMRHSGVLNISETMMKKKRGRPRKYGPDGSMALALSPFSSASGYLNNSMSEPSAKRRGRPPGSGKKQQLDALGSGGTGFTPHVITVKAGEDVASKIMTFSQQGPRAVCILSANGAICNATVRQQATSGGTVTYEGRFEIISLSGSFMLTENGGHRSRTGGLSVALAGSDGRVLGGGVAGVLMAATPVQVVVASFISEGKKPKPEPIITREPPSVPPQMAGLGAQSASSPPSQGTSSESSDDPGSNIDQSIRTSWNKPSQDMPTYASVSWPHSVNLHRHDPDMKLLH